MPLSWHLRLTLDILLVSRIGQKILFFPSSLLVHFACLVLKVCSPKKTVICHRAKKEEAFMEQIDRHIIPSDFQFSFPSLSLSHDTPSTPPLSCYEHSKVH